MMLMSCYRINSSLVFSTKRPKTIFLEKLKKQTILLEPCMRPEKLNLNWPKENYLGLSLPQPFQLRLLKRAKENLILISLTAGFMDILITKVSALPLVKVATHVVVRTTESKCKNWSRRTNDSRRSARTFKEESGKK